VRQAAEALQVSTSTVYQLCAQGRLPHFRVSNAIRIEPSVLERFCAQGAPAIEGDAPAKHGAGVPSVSEDASPKERPGASEDPEEALR
jgi:excisionase family DNA binding protein